MMIAQYNTGTLSAGVITGDVTNVSCTIKTCDVPAGVIIGNDTSDCNITLEPILQEQLQAIMGAFVVQYNTWT